MSSSGSYVPTMGSNLGIFSPLLSPETGTLAGTFTGLMCIRQAIWKISGYLLLLRLLTAPARKDLLFPKTFQNASLNFYY